MQHGEQPLVSVLMTAYNREKYIVDAIESVLASSYTNFELIITDDCSSDGTVQIAREYEVKDPRVKVYVNEQNLGDYPNRNKAASLASGKYIKYVDSDDMIYPYGLKVFVDAMEKHPGAALGITSRNTTPMQPFPILLSPEQSYRKHFFTYGILDCGPTGVIIRRDVFEQHNRFSGKRYIGDQECWFKLAARHQIVELAPALIFWRQHDGQEFKIGYDSIDGGYFMMSLPMLREALSDVRCPLTGEEKKRLLQQQHRHYARTLIKHVLKTGNIGKVRKKFAELGVSINDAF